MESARGSATRRSPGRRWAAAGILSSHRRGLWAPTPPAPCSCTRDVSAPPPYPPARATGLLAHRATFVCARARTAARRASNRCDAFLQQNRSEEHTSELQSLAYLVCRLLLEKKKQHAVQL